MNSALAWGAAPAGRGSQHARNACMSAAKHGAEARKPTAAPRRSRTHTLLPEIRVGMRHACVRNGTSMDMETMAASEQ
eukprot:5253128-Pleurochrysis_carterae.AAC.2